MERLHCSDLIHIVNGGAHLFLLLFWRDGRKDGGIMANTPVLSPEAWEAVKAASIKGVSDTQLAESFGVETNAIRQRRFLDPVWRAAYSATREAVRVVKSDNEEKLTENLTEGEKGAEIAQKTASTIQEAIQGGKLQNELLLLQIASKGLKQADGNLPQVKAWSDIKAIADIVSKIGPQASASVQVNVLTDGQAHFSAFEFPSFESEPLDIEEIE